VRRREKSRREEPIIARSPIAQFALEDALSESYNGVVVSAG